MVENNSDFTHITEQQGTNRNTDAQQQEYTTTDLEQWQHGAEAFHEFFWKATADAKENILSLTPHTIGCLQAMFLGEKAMSFKLDLGNLNKKTLDLYGFKQVDDYLYKPELIARIVQQYPSFFISFDSQDPDIIMETLSKMNLDKHAIARGILLGFPVKSTQQYAEHQHLQIHDVGQRLYDLFPPESDEAQFLLKHFFGDQVPNDQQLVDFFAKHLVHLQGVLKITEQDIPRLIDELRERNNVKQVDVYGVKWVDFSPSQESEQKQRRLSIAFEQSGILDT